MSGVYAAAFGHRFGAYLLLSGFALTLVIHLALGVVGYREVMNRPWPQVPPLEDDDEW